MPDVERICDVPPRAATDGLVGGAVGDVELAATALIDSSPRREPRMP